MRLVHLISCVCFFVVLSFGSLACSSTQAYKTQNYAKLKSSETFEREFDSVWRAIEKVLSEYTIIERIPADVAPSELADLDERMIKTDWIVTTSKDKYVEYKVNGFPRKKFLQIRFQYHVKAEKVTGGTNVRVSLNEEIQELDQHGNGKDYISVSETDSIRARELLDQVRLALYAQ